MESRHLSSSSMVLKRRYVDEVAGDYSAKRVNQEKRSSAEDGSGKAGELFDGALDGEMRRAVLWLQKPGYTQTQIPVKIGRDHQVDVPSWEEQQKRKASNQSESESEVEYEKRMMGTCVFPTPK